MVQKLEKLTKEEIEFVKETSLESQLESSILESRKFKTFLTELKKIEKEFGYTPNNLDITNMITNLGFAMFENMEYYVSMYDDDLKKGARVYFNNYY